MEYTKEEWRKKLLYVRQVQIEKDAYAQHIQGDEEQILHNNKISNKHTYMSKKASEILGFNTKGNCNFISLLEHTNIAVSEEKHIFEDVKTMLGTIGCNVGLFITELQKSYLYGIINPIQINTNLKQA